MIVLTIQANRATMEQQWSTMEQVSKKMMSLRRVLKRSFKRKMKRCEEDTRSRPSGTQVRTAKPYIYR